MEKRTPQQNRAFHLLFQQIADTLNEHGLDMRQVLKPEVDIPWTKETVKEYIWRPIQKAMFEKTSTTELTTDQVDQVYSTINRFLGEKHGLHFPFPEAYHEALYKQLSEE